MASTMELSVASNGIGWLRFTAPERRNPFSRGFAADLKSTLAEAAKREDIRTLIMTGGDHFSCGGDLKEFRSLVGARASNELMDAVNEAALAAYMFPKPLIAAVHGVAFGAGMSLAMSADMIVASEKARFCQAFIRIGGCPDTGSSWLLQRRVGAPQALKLTLTGREIDGVAAARIGLTDETVPDEKVNETAEALAREMAAHSVFALTVAKKVHRQVAETGFAQALEIEGRAQALLLQGHDFREAMAAFSEKRAAVIKDQ